MPETSKPVSSFKVFVSFASEDENLKNKLEKQINSLKRKGLVIIQDRCSIQAGTEIDVQVEKYINESHIILLLISPDFLHSDQCYSELEKAIERHQEGIARALPIILRAVEWESTPLRNLKIFPTDARPITQWSDQDEAFLDVIKGIREVVEELTKQEYRKEEEQFISKISLYKKETETNSDDHIAWRNLALVWEELGGLQKANFLEKEAMSSYEQASTAYKKLTELQPQSYIALSKQGSVLEKLDQPEDAAASYEKALDLKPNDYILLSKNGSVQEKLERHDKAIISYDKILELKQDDYIIWTQRGTVLINLGRYKEAIDSYNRALKIKPNYRAAKYHQRLAYRKIMDQH